MHIQKTKWRSTNST